MATPTLIPDDLRQHFIQVFASTKTPPIPSPFTLVMLPSLVTLKDSTKGRILGMTILFGQEELDYAYWCFHLWDMRGMNKLNHQEQEQMRTKADEPFKKVSTTSLSCADDTTFMDVILLVCRLFRDWSVETGQPVGGVSFGLGQTPVSIFRLLVEREREVNPEDPITRWDVWYMRDDRTKEKYPLKETDPTASLQ